MSRDWRLYIQDVVESCNKVMQFTEGMSQKEFEQDEKTYDAVVRNLEIIGEAIKRIPVDVLTEVGGIDWRGAAGLRDMLAHAYFGIDNDIIWDVIRNKIPELFTVTSRFLEGEEQ